MARCPVSDRLIGVSVSGVIDNLSSYGVENVDLFTHNVPGTLPPPLLVVFLLIFWEVAVIDLLPPPSTGKVVDHLWPLPPKK